jgi:hypothetical protein
MTPMTHTSLAATAVVALVAAFGGCAGKDSRIDAVLLDQRWGASGISYSPVTLYADGTYTRDADAALTDNARTGGRWRKRGADYWLSELGREDKRISGKMTARPAKPKQALRSTYGSFSTVGGGHYSTMVVSWRNYEFAADGTLRLDRGAGSSTPDSTNSRTSAVTRSTAKGVGRYTLDGYRITIVLDDDSKQHALFYFYPDSDDVIGVGSRVLTKHR